MHRLARFWSRTWKPIVASALVLLVFACGGGGCSGCAGCGISPIPGAFPQAQRIPNSAQVRLTSGGIDFIESNITPIVENVLGGGLDFPVHRIDQSISLGIGSVTIHICDDDHCGVRIGLQTVDITPTAPNRLVVHLRATIQGTHGNNTDVATYTPGAWPGTCDLTIDSGPGSRNFIGITAVLELRNITGHPARDGYTQLVVVSVDQTSGEGIEDADFDIGGPFYCGIGNLGFIKNLILDQLNGQIAGLLNGAIGDNLCQRPAMYADGTTGCPTGTFAVGTGANAVCRYANSASAECVPTLLGMDGRGDLGGQFLGGFSPGTHAPIQLVLAAGGDGQAVNMGMTVDMVGGFMSMDRTFMSSPGHNACVPRIDPPTPFPPAIAQAAAFQGNVIPGTSTSAHVGIGIAEDYLNYAGYGMFDSGMLCIGTGTRLSQQLSTGLLSALARSLNSLTFPDDNAAVAIAVRPQQPPHFDIGTDASSPLLTVTLPEAMIDFYVWSSERYIRFMTYQTDLVIEINLSVNDMNQLVPEIVSVTPTNSVVTNSELLSESPTALAGTLETIIHSFAGMLTSGISPFDLPAIMGFNLQVPDGGIVGINSSGDDFLSIWANLTLAAETRSIDTSLELSDLVLSPESMEVEHWGETRNTVWVHFASQGAEASEQVEYQYRVDQGPWSTWTTEPAVQIDDDVLLLQARHQIEARSRVVGASRTVDGTPAMAELLVDVLAPTVSLERSANGMVALGDDIVSEGNLTYRFRVDGEEWSEWSTRDEVALGAAALAAEHLLVEVEVRDEAGNVGRAQQALIRGLPNPAASSGCGCRVGGADAGTSPLAGLLSMVVVGLFVSRRRARAASRKERV